MWLVIFSPQHLSHPPPPPLKKGEKSFHTIIFFIYPQKETFAPTQNETIILSLKRKRSDSLLINFYESLPNDN